jgi:elongation factor Ts
MIELNTETDFVARGDLFVASAAKIADLVLHGPDGERAAPDAAITAIVDDVRIQTKENTTFARGVKVSGGRVGIYLHFNKQIGSLVVADDLTDDELLTGLCQHVVAIVPSPVAVDEAGMPREAVEKNRQAFIDEAAASGKPKEIAEKMATGKLRKWVEENTLLGQIYVKDPAQKASVRSLLPKGASIRSYVKYQVGVK